MYGEKMTFLILLLQQKNICPHFHLKTGMYLEKFTGKQLVCTMNGLYTEITKTNV